MNIEFINMSGSISRCQGVWPMQIKLVRRWLFSLCCFVVFSCSLFAQADIQGIVLEAETGQAIANAEVLITKERPSTFTDQKGEFQYKAMPFGYYDIVIFLDGYTTIQQVVHHTENTEIHEFSLRKLEVSLAEVVVSDTDERQYAIEHLRAVEGTAIYAGKKNEVVLLDKIVANTAANNARQIYNQVAGLNIYDSNDAGLQLNIGGRGLDPNRSASFNTRQNGYDISADVLGYPESYYTPTAEALQKIQVIRGAASLQYGTQFGGLVNFVFKKPKADRKIELVSRQNFGSNQLFTTFNSLSGTVGKFSYYTFFNYKKGDGFRDNSAFTSKNAYAHLGYQFSEKTSLKLEFTLLNYLAQQAGGLTDAQFYNEANFSNRTRNWFAVNWHLLALKLEHRFSVNTEMSLQLFALDASRDAVGFRTHRVAQADDLSQPRDLLKGTFQNAGAEWRLLHRHKIGQQPAVFLIGTKVYFSDNEAIQGPGSTSTTADFGIATTWQDTYPNQSDFRFPNQNVAIFAEHIFYLNEKLTATPGLRFEFINTKSEGTFRRIDFDLAGNPIRDDLFSDNRDLQRQLLLGGLGLSYKPTSSIECYGNLSQNYRSVTFSDLHVVNPSYQIDPSISDERGFTADVGMRGRVKNISYDLSLFSLRYNNRLGEVLRAETRLNSEGEPVETGRVVRVRGNIGEAVIYGLEGLLDWHILRSGKEKENYFSLNWFTNLAVTHSQYLRSDAPSVTGNRVEFMPLINLKTGLGFGYKNLHGSLQWTFLSEQFTDASNAPQNKQDNQSGIVGAIPTYHVMDLSLAWKHRFWQLEGGVNNLLNQSYFTRRATGYPGPGIIPSASRTFYLGVQVVVGK